MNSQQTRNLSYTHTTSSPASVSGLHSVEALNCVYMQKSLHTHRHTHILHGEGGGSLVLCAVLPPAAATTPFRRLVNERVASNELDCTRDYIASGTKCRVDIRERGYVTTVVKLTRARSGRRRRRRREGGINYSIQTSSVPSTSLRKYKGRKEEEPI